MIWKLFDLVFIRLMSADKAYDMVARMIAKVPPEKRKELIEAMSKAAVMAAMSR